MTAYLIRKLVGTIPIVLGVALVIFILFDMVGGDPTYMMVGKHATPERIAEIRHEYGFDQPKPVQFLNYLKQIATFDYGRSYATKQKISTMISRGIVPTLTLAVPAFTITTVLALLIGLFTAYYRGSWIDRTIGVLCAIGVSLPILTYILAGQYWLGYKLGWFPIAGYDSSFPESLAYVAMPGLIWLALSLGYDVRFYRTALLEETQQDYVRTARAKGVSEKKVFLKHVLKNGMVPIITNVVLEIPLLILGSLLLEGFFGIPGLGGITIDAVQTSDLPVIKAMGTVVSLLYILGNVMTDIVYTWVDPRVSIR